MPHGVFLRVGTAPAPEWFSHVMAGAAADGPSTIADALPFVDHFWTRPRSSGGRAGRTAPLGALHVKDAAGAEFGLVASAVVVGHRHLLVLEYHQRLRGAPSRPAERPGGPGARSPPGTDPGVVGGMATPAALAQQLAESGLAAATEQLALEIGEQLSSLSSAVEDLAPIPKGVTRSRGR